MTDPVIERANSLISKYENLSEDKKRKFGLGLAEKIDDSHAWLDVALMWFDDSDDDDDVSTTSGSSVRVTCPCGKKLKLSI